MVDCGAMRVLSLQVRCGRGGVGVGGGCEEQHRGSGLC